MHAGHRHTVVVVKEVCAQVHLNSEWCLSTASGAEQWVQCLWNYDGEQNTVGLYKGTKNFKCYTQWRKCVTDIQKNWRIVWLKFYTNFFVIYTWQFLQHSQSGNRMLLKMLETLDKQTRYAKKLVHFINSWFSSLTFITLANLW